MARRRRRSNTGIPGLSFSWKRALGITRARQRFARKTGIPTTRAGMERKVGRAVTGGSHGGGGRGRGRGRSAATGSGCGCVVLALALFLMLAILGCGGADGVQPASLGPGEEMTEATETVPASPTATMTATATATATSTSAPTATPTLAPSPTLTPTLTPTAPPTATPTATHTPTAVPPTETPTATPTATLTPLPTFPPDGAGCPYVGNRNSDVFHHASCHSVRQMSEWNKVCLTSREEAIARGFRPCGNCKP